MSMLEECLSLRVRRPCDRYSRTPGKKDGQFFPPTRSSTRGEACCRHGTAWLRLPRGQRITNEECGSSCLLRVLAPLSMPIDRRDVQRKVGRFWRSAPFSFSNDKSSQVVILVKRRPNTKATMANDSLDDMLGWLDEAMGEKDAHHSPTIAIGRSSKHSAYARRSHSCDDGEILHGHHARAPRRQKHKHAREHDHDHHNDNEQQEDDRRYQRASSYSAIDSREMNVSTTILSLAGADDTSRVIFLF